VELGPDRTQMDYNQIDPLPQYQWRSSDMKLTATEQGLLIPKDMLGENQEFELIQENDKIIITGIKKTSSIWYLGSNPVDCDVKDAAVNPDNYLYNQ
jgi:hypothetical protein